jgi:hemoglobin
MAEKSLFDRLGGANVIASVVDRFCDEIVKNPKLHMNPALRAWNKTGQLPGLKFMRTRLVSQASGGPFTYTGKDLGAAHKDRSPHHLRRVHEVGADIGRACDHFKVPEREKRELLLAIVARKGEVIRR